MGCCSSSTQQVNAVIERELLNYQKEQDKVFKLLFLGSGGSGKTTFFKQMSIIHGNGFSADDRAAYHIDICAQILEQLALMIKCIPLVNDALEDENDYIHLSQKAQNSAHFIQQLTLKEIIDKVIACHIEILFHEEAIQIIYENRAQLQIDDSMKYFLSNIQLIGDIEHYIPTDLDIINVRHRTTGVTYQEFEIGKSYFSLFDVGGQKSERKKWIHCFDGVTAVIFVSSLSSYDEIVFEDVNENAMLDSLNLFKEICENQWFVKTPIILFLNKDDLFREKIALVAIQETFAEFKQDEENLQKYSTEEGYTECVGFIQGKFLEQNVTPIEVRQMFVHITTATNRQNVDNVFEDIQDTLTKLLYDNFQTFL